MNRSQMAHQLARLLVTSDLETLRESVERWKAGAASGQERRVMEEMGERLLDVKAALDGASTRPAEEELEELLKMMLLLASDPEAVKPPRE